MNQVAHPRLQMTTDWLSGWNKIAALREEWTALHRAQDTVGAHLFNDFEFLDVWQDCFGSDRMLIALTVRDPGGSLVGIAPLQIQERSKGRVRFRRLGFAHNAFMSRCSAIMRGDFDAIAKAMAQALAAKARLFDDLVFDGMLADCAGQSALRRAIADAGFLTSETPGERPLWKVEFEGTEAEFIEKSPGKNRKNYRRAIRGCDALPDFTITITSDPARSRDLHRQLFSLDWLSGKRDRPGAIYPVEGKYFHTMLGERASALGSIEFVEAKTEGKLIGALLSVINRGVKYLYVTYSDDDYREHYVGLMVILRAIGAGLEDPAVRYVDLNGDSQLLERISTGKIEQLHFKANHRAGLSLAIGLARQLKRRMS